MTAFAERETSRTSHPAGPLEDDVAADRHHREQHQRDEREHDARAGEPHAAQPAIEGDAGEDHADRGDRRAERLERSSAIRRGAARPARP